MTSISELQQLIKVLRHNGVTHYEQGDLVLTLGPVVAQDAPTVESQPSQMPRMSEDLAAAMARLDPMYSDESLFEFGGEV